MSPLLLVLACIFVAASVVEIVLSLYGKSSTKLASIMTAVYFAVAMLFGVYVAITLGSTAYVEFLTGFVMEYALSVDNLFVFDVVLAMFAIAAHQQRLLLFLGLLGAVVMRGVFVFAGTSVIEKFTWVLPLMGVLLVYLGLKMGFGKESSEPPWLVRKVLKWGLPPFVGGLVAFEGADLFFATDSVPVILAITQNPEIALSASMLAVMGLRSLYFLLQGAKENFEYLPTALGVVLCGIGVKLVLLLWHIHVPVWAALGFTVTTLAVAVVASLRKERRQKKAV